VPVPTLETVAENVRAVLTVAVVGDAAPAVRSGVPDGGSFASEHESVVPPFAPRQLHVQLVAPSTGFAEVPVEQL